MLRAQYSPQITDKKSEGKKTHAHKEGSLPIEKPGRGLTDKREEIAVWPEREGGGGGTTKLQHFAPSSSGGLDALCALLLRAFFRRISDLIGDVFSCVGRLKRVSSLVQGRMCVGNIGLLRCA